MAPPKFARSRHYLLAVALSLLSLPIARELDAPSSCFILVAMASALYGGRGPALLATLLSAGIFILFFLSSRFEPIAQHAPILRFAVFMGAMLLSIEMIEAKRRSERGRLQAQESLRSTQAQLEKATQSAMISELSASIVHEISQPISAMAANGQACLNWLEAEPPHLDEARIATRCVVRDGNDAAEIITGLRSLFRQAPLEKMPLAVAAVIAEVASLLRARLERENVRLELGIPEPFPLVPADKTQLQQVLVNLATNGVDAMQHTVGRPKVLVIRAQRDAGSALFEIEDCGAGVADFDTIFDSFFTTKQTGLGMGLSICRTIVEKHGGRIWGKPSPTGGTVFSFTLPLG